MMRFLPFMLLLGAVLYQAHSSLDATGRTDTAFNKEVLPSNEAASLISLGYDNVVADYYWLRAISHFGDRRMHAYDYPNLLGFLELVLALDPKFDTAYFFAGSVLTVGDANLKHAMRILKTGRKERPDNWRITYMLGFNYYMYYRDFAQAAALYAETAKNPEAPPVIGKLAIKLAAEAQKPEIGIAMIDAMLNDVQDERLRELYMERRSLLVLEQELLWFQQTIDSFTEKFGHTPTTLQELVDARLIRQLPENDPVGGEYFISQDGRAATTSENRRLKLSAQAKERLK